MHCVRIRGALHLYHRRRRFYPLSLLFLFDEMRKNVLVLIMAMIVFLVANTQTTSKSKHLPDKTYQKCGKYLSSLLAIVCESKYNTPIPTRLRHTRSVAETEVATEEPSWTTEEPKGILKTILAREEARSLLSFRRRRRRGVYDECCKKSCTYSELRAYCASTS